MSTTAETAKHKTAGLAGVVAGQTAISTVGQEDLGLTYRGYAIEDLARAASFEEVAYLLIHGSLPSRSQLDEYQRRLMGQRGLPDALRDILARLPAAAHPMDVLRTGCSALGCLEPEAKLSDGERIADRLVAASPRCFWIGITPATRASGPTCSPSNRAWRDTSSNCCTAGRRPARSGRAKRLADPLRGARVQRLDFCRADCRLDFVRFLFGHYCGDRHIAGPLHGGANEAALDLICRFSTPDEAEKGVQEALAAKAKIMGFGHRVYKEFDPAQPHRRADRREAGRQPGAPPALRRCPADR